MRLRPGAWLIEHPADWSEAEQRDFASTIGTPDGIDLSFKADVRADRWPARQG